MAWRGPTVQAVLNPAPNKISHGKEMSEMRVTQNRALNKRRDKDTQKNFSVSLMDVDATIINYLDTTISPMVVDAGRLVKVPVNYASGERWQAIRKNGYMRDKHGKVQCPALVVRRTTMQRNDNLITLNRYLNYPTIKKFSEKNQYDRFSAMSGFKPVQEIYSVAMPDHVIINYDFIVWTELVEQGNGIIEKINFSTEDYWGDKHSFKFRTSISDYNFQVEVNADQDRIVKTTFSMMVYAYLLPESFENYKETVKKAFTPRKIVFTGETTGKTLKQAQTNVAKTTELNGNKVPIIGDPDVYEVPPIQNTDWKNRDALEYQSFLITRTGSLLSFDGSGTGSCVYEFVSTSFNTEQTTSDYQKFMLFVDDHVVKHQDLSYYVSGSSLIASVKTDISGVTPTTSSLIMGYGNII